MRGFFEENDIPYVDTLLALQEAVEAGNAIYTITFDGHPSANGYRIIAEVVNRYISENDVME